MGNLRLNHKSHADQPTLHASALRTRASGRANRYGLESIHDSLTVQRTLAGLTAPSL